MTRPALITTDELVARAEELHRLADELEPAELRRRKRALLDDVGGNLSRISSDIAEIQEALDAQTEPTTETIYLPVHFGSPAPYVREIEKAARSAKVRCRTRVVRTGLLSKEVAFELHGSSIAVSLLIDSVKNWSQTNGIGWTTY